MLENSYYVDALVEDDPLGRHSISINRPKNSMHDSSFKPEKDLMYDTNQGAFGNRRRTTGPSLARLKPLPAKKGGFLRKGEGNGGSPTNYVLRQQVNENG